MRIPWHSGHLFLVKIKVSNFLLLVGAFIVAGFASIRGIARFDGGDLSGVLTSGSLILFVCSAALLCSVGLFRSQSAEWEGLSQLLGGQYSVAEAGVHGRTKGLSVFARVESSLNNLDYLDRTCALYSSSKHFFTLTITVPYQDQSSWRVVYRPKNEEQLYGQWHAVCENSPELAQSLEMSGIVDLFSAWDKFTVVKCDGSSGKLTLRYPAPHRFFCPTPDELESEINLLRRAGDIWQHAVGSRIAA